MAQLGVLMFERADRTRDLARDWDGQAVHSRTNPAGGDRHVAQEASRGPNCGLRGMDRVLEECSPSVLRMPYVTQDVKRHRMECQVMECSHVVGNARKWKQGF